MSAVNLTILMGLLLIFAGLGTMLGLLIGGRGRRANAETGDPAERCATTLEQPVVHVPGAPVHNHSRTWDETVTIGIPEHLRDRLMRK